MTNVIIQTVHENGLISYSVSEQKLHKLLSIDKRTAPWFANTSCWGFLNSVLSS